MSDGNDELLKRAERLKQRSEARKKTRRSKNKSSNIGKTSRHIRDLHTGLIQANGTIGWLYNHVIAPVVTHPWAGAPFRGYKALWGRVVHVRDADGDLQFSKQRAGTMVLVTWIALWMMPAFLSGTVEFVWDVGRMVTSYQKDEILYLGKSEEIDPQGNVFSAQGCVSIHCSDQTSIYFRIKPSLAHHIWSLNSSGNLFFPDYVSAGIQNDINRCKVTGYGLRWKLIVRNWDVYPQILSVDCAPVTDEEVKAASEALRAE